MKKYFRTSLFAAIMICLLASVAGCKKTSTSGACIQSIPASASVGALITFAACDTTAAGTYTWNFGDGSNPYTGPVIYHSFGAPGTYQGSLTLTNGGTTTTRTFSITIIRNNWTILGTTYNTDSVTASASAGTLAAFNMTQGNANTLTFLFPTLPTAGGNYAVVNYNTIPTGNQVAVFAYKYMGQIHTLYGSSGGGTATVSVSGGRISLSMPAISVVNSNNAADSSTLSVGITQTQ